MARVVLTLSLLVTASVLAGCVDESSPLEPFSSLAAPAWEAGYTWTWDGTQSGTWTYAGEDGTGSSSGSETRQLTHTVVNTKQPALDTSVYWVRSSERIGMDGPLEDGIFGHEGLQALAKSDLQPVAFASEDMFSGPFDECGSESLSLYPADPFPHLRFPLERGATWQGELEDHVTMHAEVLGAREITVPAGTFDAIEVRLGVDVAPEFFEEEQEVKGVSSSTTVWYAEAVRNIVRLESELEVHFTEDMEYMGGGEGTMESATSIELVSFDLVAGTEEELPQIVHGFDPYRDHGGRDIPPLVIATNTSFPLNAATDPLAVTFGLAEDDGSFDHMAPGITRVDAVPTELPWLDAENQTVQWMLMSRGGYEVMEGTTVDLTLPPGGRFDLTAQVVPKTDATADGEKCAVTIDRVMIAESSTEPVPIPMPPRIHPMYHLASGAFEVEWHEDFAVDHSGLQEARYTVAEVPLVVGGHLLVEYEVSDDGPFDDAGYLVVIFENGEERRVDELGQGISPDRAGLATLEWVAEAGYLGVTFGHEVQGTIDVVY